MSKLTSANPPDARITIDLWGEAAPALRRLANLLLNAVEEANATEKANPSIPESKREVSSAD